MPYKPKLNLSFNPPITTETEYTDVINLLNAVYPGLRWYSGKNVTEANMFKLRGCSFYSFNIGYFPEEPNRLTYTSGPLDDEDIPHQDGRQWVKDHTVDVEDIFNKLHESEEKYRPKLLLSFDPLIETVESLNKVLDVLDAVYPGLTWVNHKSVLTYNTFEQEIGVDSFIGTLTIGFWKEQPDELSWGGSREGDEVYDYELYEDGWRWVEKYTPSVDDAFSKLYESENKIDYTFLRHQDVLGLQFYHPIEYEETGIFYTIVDDDGEELKIKWEGRGRGSLEWDDFIGDLNRGFYFIKDDNVKTTIDNFNTLFESEGVRTIHRGDKVYVPAWRQIGTIEAIIGNNGSKKKITEISPGICAKGIIFSIVLDEVSRWVYLSRGQFEFPKMSSEDAFSKLYESEEDGLEWVKDLSQTLHDPVTRNPAIGTKVKIKFTHSNNPCPPDEDTPYDTIHEGVIVKTGGKDNPGDLLVLFNNMSWQDDCGWSCNQEGFSSDFRCWWTSVDNDTIYLSGHKQVRGPDMVSDVRIRESEDEFEWARESLNQLASLPIPDGNRHVIVFKNPNKYNKDEVLNVLNQLTSLGWNWAGSGNNDIINSFFRYFKDDLTPYIRLQTTGGMSYGSRESTFREVTGTNFNQSNTIYI